MPSRADAPPSRAAWRARLRPPLARSLAEAGEAITRTPAIQRWLREAPFRVARDLGMLADAQAAAHAELRMLDDLAGHFPALAGALADVTGRRARLDLHWRPLQPSFSQVRVALDRPFAVDLFYRLPACTPEAAQGALDALTAALPASTPFPGHPNEATALVAYDGPLDADGLPAADGPRAADSPRAADTDASARRDVGLRVRDRLDADTGARRRTFALLRAGAKPLGNLARPDAARGLVTVLGA